MNTGRCNAERSWEKTTGSRDGRSRHWNLISDGRQHQSFLSYTFACPRHASTARPTRARERRRPGQLWFARAPFVNRLNVFGFDVELAASATPTEPTTRGGAALLQPIPSFRQRYNPSCPHCPPSSNSASSVNGQLSGGEHFQFCYAWSQC